MTTVTMAHPTEAEKRLRTQVLLSQMIVQHDPIRRNVGSFAKRVGVSRQHIYRALEAGRCSMPLARRLQKVFGKTAAPLDELCWSILDK